MEAIKIAGVEGLLLSYGFMNRLVSDGSGTYSS